MLKAAFGAAGAYAGTRFGGAGAFLGEARAAATVPNTAIVMIHLNGGFNSIFTGADAFTNTAFGVTANNVTNIGGGLVIDTTLADAIPMNLRTRVASLGIRHGNTDHDGARRQIYAYGGGSGPLMLADAIGGSAAIKAAVVGGNSLPPNTRPAPVNGVSLQPINDMRATIDAIAGATPAANVADRAGSVKGLSVAQLMSKTGITKHKASLSSADQGFAAAVETLKKPVIPFNVNEFNTAYALQGTAVGNQFRAKMAAAELMVRAGSNFVMVQDDFVWDTHGDTNGNNVRNMMTGRIATPLRTFLTRAIEGTLADRNVTLVMVGDFARSLPGSDHQANLSALVIGKSVKNATTGKTDARVALGPGVAGTDGLWQFLAATGKLDASPFAAGNPHAALMA